MQLYKIIFCLTLFTLSQVKADPKRVKYKEVVVDSVKNEFNFKNNEKFSNQQRILISILINNHAHSLPEFLASLEKLECPTLNKKCDLW